MKPLLFLPLLFTVLLAANVKIKEPKCHPQCAWKCDDPKCPGSLKFLIISLFYFSYTP